MGDSSGFDRDGNGVGNVTKKAEFGPMGPQTRECQQLPEAGQRNGFPDRGSKENVVLPTS